MDTVTSPTAPPWPTTGLRRGPAVVLVSGGSTDRMANAGLAAELARHHTVYNFDRRGRGDSGDTPPYAIEREVDGHHGRDRGRRRVANLYGTSSGRPGHARRRRRRPREPSWPCGSRPTTHGRPDLPDDTASVYRELVESGGVATPPSTLAKVVGLPPSSWPTPPGPLVGPAGGHRPHPRLRRHRMGDYTLPTEIAKARSRSHPHHRRRRQLRLHGGAPTPSPP
jgi:hypothetical protein